MIVRVFTAIVREGQEDEFEKFFLQTALPLVRSQRGLISVTLGLPHEASPRQFAMVTVWRDVDALKAFSGEEWQKAVIHPREEHLIEKTTVAHYYAAGGSGLRGKC